MIYFDNAATYIDDKKEVLDFFLKAQTEFPANSNSLHRLGYLSNQALDKARKDILTALRLDNQYEVVFTSGATEGINLAIKGYALKNKSRGNKIISFVNEHPAVLNSLHYLEKKGFEVVYVSSNEEGVINYQEIEKNIDKNTIMLVAMSVNNEVGSENDIKKIYDIVKNYPKCVFFSDVTQSVGKIIIPYSLLDMFAFSAHKFGGLIGSGVLVKKKKIMLEKQSDGGHQENDLRSGTVAVPLALSTAFALTRASKYLDVHYSYVYELYELAIDALKEIPEIEINSPDHLPYIINFSLKNKKASVLVEALSNNEIYVSSLSACDSKTNKVSYVIDNMYHDKRRAENSIRISFSHKNTKDEVNTFIAALKKIIPEIR